MAHKRLCIALICDVVGSRRQSGRARALLQETLEARLAALNDRYRDAILAKFVVTAGDEFQGLLKDARVIADILWDLEPGAVRIKLRVGIGLGTLETALKRFAVGMDGPVWHRARGAIELARAGRRMGGVFHGFGEREDGVLNGLARLLHALRSRLSPKQLPIIQALRKGASQVNVARRLRLTKQAVNNRSRSAAWGAYREGEEALRGVLSDFNFRERWP
jgi:hypothetical protein